MHRKIKMDFGSEMYRINAQTIIPLLILTLKVATVSLASVTVFSGLDPDRLSIGLMWYGCPERLSFSISYAYRMLPMFFLC